MLQYDPSVPFPEKIILTSGVCAHHLNRDQILIFSPVETFLMRLEGVSDFVRPVVRDLKEGVAYKDLFARHNNPDFLEYFLDVLFMKGCIIEAGYSEHPSGRYFEKQIAKTRNFSGVDAYLETLERNNFAIISCIETNAESIARNLISLGLEYNEDSANLILIVNSYGEEQKKIVSRYTQSSKKVFLISVSSEEIQVGPVFDIRHTDENEYKRGCSEFFDMTATEEAFIASVLFKQITKLTKSLMGTAVLRFNRIERISRIESIPVCAGGRGGVELYEASIRGPAAEDVCVSDQFDRYKPDFLALCGEIECSSTWKKLDSVLRSLFPEELIEIFRYTVGFNIHNRSKENKRIAPTAGNLGSVNLCFVNKNPEFLAGAGLYYYHPQTEEIFQLDNEAFVEKFEKNVAEALNKDIYVLLIGDIRRPQERYGLSAYKFCQYDVGIALAQLTLLAKAQCCTGEIIWAYDERQIRQDMGFWKGFETIGAIVGLECEAQ